MHVGDHGLCHTDHIVLNNTTSSMKIALETRGDNNSIVLKTNFLVEKIVVT